MWNSNHWYYQRVSKYKYAIAIQSMQSFFHFIVLEVHWQLGLLVSSSAVTSYHTYKGDKADMSKKLSDKDVFKVPIEFSKKYHLTALKFRYNMYLCTGNFWHASHMSPAQVCLVVCHTFGSALSFCNHFTSQCLPIFTRMKSKTLLVCRDDIPNLAPQIHGRSW